MRLLPFAVSLSALALTALVLSAGGVSAQQAKPKAPVAKALAAPDWRNHVVQAPTGAIRIGNPAAKVRLVEYLSYSCSHCAQFVAESKAPLKDDLIRRGVVRIEVRHAVRDPLDMAAAMLARCSGPRRFAGSSEAIFAAQSDWMRRGGQWWQANAENLAAQPELVRLKAAANASGLSQLMIARGMTPTTINQCFATTTDLDRLAAMADAAWKVIGGTPSFVVNDRMIGSGDWSVLQPELRAAGAR